MPKKHSKPPKTTRSSHANHFSSKSIYPPVVTTTLTFVGTTIMTSGSSYVYKKFQSNDAYDLDITGSGTNMSGKATLIDRYAKFFVDSYTYEAEVGAKESFPAVFTVVESNTDPGSLGANLKSLKGANIVTSHLLGSINGGDSVVKFRGGRTIAELTGSTACRTADSFAGLLASSSPTDKTHLVFQLDNLGQANATSGCVLLITIRLTGRFMSRVADVYTLLPHSVPAPAEEPEAEFEDIEAQISALRRQLSLRKLKSSC